ncbi:MAG: inositol monophosphatase [Geminicoccaceae bacterium]
MSAGRENEAGKAAAPAEPLLREIETTAVELARLAGAAIVGALGRTLAVRYKDLPEAVAAFRDPVSEVDQAVEVLLRARLAERFPEHDVIGEEMDERPGRDHDFVWVVDPIDGTTNFVNGFPMFACSIGVLWRGLPVVGALWCSTSHALRSGVYHARHGGMLQFDEEPLEARRNAAVRRGLAGEPYAGGGDLPWDTRQTGSAAIEGAFVAAGLLRATWFNRPNIWDVGGAVPLVRAAGGEVRASTGPGGWAPLERFEPQAAVEGGQPDLRHWRRALVLGEPEAVALLCRHLGETHPAE